MAKPRTGPEPTPSSTIAAIRAVKLESRMVPKAVLKPRFDRTQRAPAVPPLFTLTLEDDDVRVHRHTHGEHDAGDTGRVSVKPMKDMIGDQHHEIDEERDVGEDTEETVRNHHEDHDEREAHDRGDQAGTDRVGA